MKIRIIHRAVAFLALLLWLMTSWMGVHSHFCFDGKEPAVSFHVDIVEGHEVHAEEDEHQDIDISQSALVKLLKFYSSSLLLATIVIIIFLYTRSLGVCFYTSLHLAKFLPDFRPPLRAPPVIIA
ncbi:MAG: hypothetical protein B0W54_15005 [Cellvibrio sp. 79]|nr:MAG: hypothetical protein B0W54_15005 [Cellvibrio sp. 79]